MKKLTKILITFALADFFAFAIAVVIASGFYKIPSRIGTCLWMDIWGAIAIYIPLAVLFGKIVIDLVRDIWKKS